MVHRIHTQFNFRYNAGFVSRITILKGFQLTVVMGSEALQQHGHPGPIQCGFFHLNDTETQIENQVKLNGEKNYFVSLSFGARGSVVVEALCYKPEGRGIASR
jgi:hypothetical protein